MGGTPVSDPPSPASWCLVVVAGLFLPWLVYKVVELAWLVLSMKLFPWKAHYVDPSELTGAYHIPPIIHRVVTRGSESNGTFASLPPNWKRAVQSCDRLNPHFTQEVWDEDAAMKLITRDYPKHLATVRKYTKDVQKADVYRYFILHSRGGIYLDLDIGCRSQLDSLRRVKGAIVPETHPFAVSNDIIASPPEHELLLRLIDGLNAWRSFRLLSYPTILFSTGPGYASHQALRQIRSDHIANATAASTNVTRSVFILPPKRYGHPRTAYFYHVPGSHWQGADASFLRGEYPRSLLVALALLVCLCWLLFRRTRRRRCRR